MALYRTLTLIACFIAFVGCGSDDSTPDVDGSHNGGRAGAANATGGDDADDTSSTGATHGGASGGANATIIGGSGGTGVNAGGEPSGTAGSDNVGTTGASAGTAGVETGFGGTSTGGTSTGGTSTGGTSTGGTSTGGTSTGGTSTGGTSTGGTSTGGTSTGGTSTGGTSTGGTSTGGTSTGGTSTGGTSTGGTTVATGGTSTGGATVATGGTSTGGATVATGGTSTSGTAGAGGSTGTGTTIWDDFDLTCDKLDVDRDGFSECEGDCDDTNPSILPSVVDANVGVAGNGSSENPYKTITQAAVGSYAKPCRAIVLRPGTYTDPTQTISFITSTGGPAVTFWEPPAGQYAITYQSTGDVTVRGITIRSGGATRARGINFLRPTTGTSWCGNLTLEASVLQGLDRAVFVTECIGTISIKSNVFRNNSCPYDSNYLNCGAVADRAFSGGSMTYDIINNLFESNVSGGRGGAIALHHVFGRIEGNVFRDNSAEYEGGAIYLGSSGGTTDFYVRKNWFGGNASNRSGGALHAAVTSGINIFIENNVFNANTAAGDGGGAYLYGPTGATRVLVNNTFVDNSAGRGGHVHVRLWPGEIMANAFIFSQGGGGVSAETWTDIANAPVFTYNNAFLNMPDYTGALTALTITGQNGNISEESGWLKLVDDLDPDNDDLHLGTVSSMRDAGPPRPASMNDVDGSRNDIGAYGGPYGNW